MTQIQCPNCGEAMTTVQDHDITTDTCASCGGVFLDKAELNALATGMAGDIEYCSVDDTIHADKFAERSCPRCDDQEMHKVCLLCYTDIVF
ncbi:MAG: zf-TFIIB domain-containing protein, partial [bacterium]